MSVNLEFFPLYRCRDMYIDKYLKYKVNDL